MASWPRMKVALNRLFSIPNRLTSTISHLMPTVTTFNPCESGFNWRLRSSLPTFVGILSEKLVTKLVYCWTNKLVKQSWMLLRPYKNVNKLVKAKVTTFEDLGLTNSFPIPWYLRSESKHAIWMWWLVQDKINVCPYQIVDPCVQCIVFNNCCCKSATKSWCKPCWRWLYKELCIKHR